MSLDTNYSPPAEGVPATAVCLQHGVRAQNYKTRGYPCLHCKDSCTWLHIKPRLTLQATEVHFHNPQCVIACGYFIDFISKLQHRFTYEDAVTRKLITFAYYPEQVTTPVGYIPAGSWTVEVYQGANYIVGTSWRSYSRSYHNGHGLPEKYLPMVEQLRKMITVDPVDGRLETLLLQVKQA